LAQAVELLLSKHEALSSNSSHTKKKRRRRKKSNWRRKINEDHLVV
jgi:hypothetical protein